MKELGGFFQLELHPIKKFHANSLALNSARNCFKYILQAKKPTKIYLPAYCCDSLIDVLISENIDFEFYHIDVFFEITELPDLKPNERILYINYFGFKSSYIKYLHVQYSEYLIIDNTQSFFEKPIPGVDTIYSPRKFFGVSDGGYLYTKNILDVNLESDCSVYSFQHLLGRYEVSASEFYDDYQKAEKRLIGQPIKLMSKLTQDILNSLDYEKIALKRQRNFWMLHSLLNEFEQIDFLKKIKIDCAVVPMGYPYYSSKSELRLKLIKNKIYVAKYWPDALKRINKTEYEMIEQLILLPIDQRVDIDDINRIAEVLND